MTESIKFTKDGVEAVIPKELYMAVVRVQSEEGLDWSEACKRTGELSQSGSEQFKEAVKTEARRLHNSEFMVQLNKARRKIEEDAFGRAKRMYEIFYYCKICQGMITVPPNGDEHRAIIQYMYDHHWRHVSCPQRMQ